MAGSLERPADESTLARLVRDAFVTKSAIRVAGGGSKAAMAPPIEAALTIETVAMAGLTLHEPAELVIAARAGTRLSEVVAALDAKGQMLPFEPADYRVLLGSEGAEPTIGGLVAVNLSGSRRVTAGACRDSLIGVRFVNGRGEAIKSGGRVMKNVTGYDLSKLMAGSWGTLGILTEATFKILPKPEATASLAWSGLSEENAVDLMSAALGSPYEVAAAAHRPARATQIAMTIIRIENFASSVAYRSEALARELARFGKAERLDAAQADTAWRQIRDVLPFATTEGSVWRISVAPSKATELAKDVRHAGAAELFYDWGGGLIWVLTPEAADAAEGVRLAARRQGGHAMLVRSSQAFRRADMASRQGDSPLAALTRRVKDAFDPAGILNPGRMI